MLDLPYLNRLIDDLSAHDIAPEHVKALRQAIEELDTLRRKVQLAAEALGAKLPTNAPPGKVEYIYDCAICGKHHVVFLPPRSRPKYCQRNAGEPKSECQREAARRAKAKPKRKERGRFEGWSSVNLAYERESPKRPRAPRRPL